MTDPGRAQPVDKTSRGPTISMPLAFMVEEVLLERMSPRCAWCHQAMRAYEPQTETMHRECAEDARAELIDHVEDCLD